MEQVYTFYCHHCNRVKSRKSEFSTGYASSRENPDEKTCFDCCSAVDRMEMIETGASKGLPLYLSYHKKPNIPVLTDIKVTNWPGTLAFKPFHYRIGNHNMARTRYDVWFDGPDGFVWHGVQYGEWTQICHCKRTKEVSRR